MTPAKSKIINDDGKTDQWGDLEGSLTLDSLIGLGRGRLTGWQLIGDSALVGQLNTNIGTLQRFVVSIFAGIL